MQTHLHDCIDKENDDADGVERHEDAHWSASSAPSTGCLRLHGWTLKISKSTMMLGLAQLTWIPGPPMDGLMPGTGPGRRSFSMVCCLVRTGTEMDEICNLILGISSALGLPYKVNELLSKIAQKSSHFFQTTDPCFIWTDCCTGLS